MKSWAVSGVLRKTSGGQWWREKGICSSLGRNQELRKKDAFAR